MQLIHVHPAALMVGLALFGAPMFAVSAAPKSTLAEAAWQGDFAAAVNEFKNPANMGIVKAQVKLGLFYRNGPQHQPLVA